jgi:hypothetical protein
MKSACRDLVYDFIEYLVFCCIELDIKHFFKYMDSNIKTCLKKYHRLWVYFPAETIRSWSACERMERLMAGGWLLVMRKKQYGFVRIKNANAIYINT